MTKERRIAIQMWKRIKTLLPRWYASDRNTVGDKVLMYKHKFCSRKKVTWIYDCWLCHYVGHIGVSVQCRRCPLKSCNSTYDGGDSPWQIVMQSRYSLEKKLDACDIIIKALKRRP